MPDHGIISQIKDFLFSSVQDAVILVEFFSIDPGIGFYLPNKILNI